MAVDVRLATRADLPAIERLMQASISSLSRGFYDEQQTASAMRYIGVPDVQLIDDGTYYVIDDDRQPPTGNRQTLIAAGGWSARAKLFTGTSDQDQVSGFSDVARIRAMFVDPSQARRGLGRRILEASEEAARSAGFTTLELMATLPGVPLYERCGYVSVERSHIELPDGVRLGVVLMRKSPGHYVQGP
ncbi:MAG TPA: GNAT family N-acetyltransferase [Thermoanaerobaculia bacterium]|nr:GNAT family N-acetyltransferase [Thermoanaerobaculia bacterium]